MKFLILLSVIALAYAKQGCEYPDIEKCNTVEGAIAKGKFPDNEADVNDLCAKLKAGGQCLRGKADECLSKDHADKAKLLLDKEKELLDKICGSGIAQFIEYAKSCFNKDEVLKGLKDIHTHYVDIVEAAQGFDKATYKQSICCSQLYSRENIKALNNKNCGADKAEYLDNLLKKTIGELFHKECGSPNSYADCAAKLQPDIKSKFDEIIKASPAPAPKHKFAVPTLIEMATALNL